MQVKIAVLIDDNGDVAEYNQAKRLLVYEKPDVQWQTISEYQINPDAETSIAEIRNGVKKIVELLDDCHILICKKITGVAYHTFEKYRFDIYEMDEVKTDIFDQVIKDSIDAKEETKVLFNIPKEPYSPNNDGIYYLNLIELQQNFPEISSKQAMRRFMEQEVFYQFELKCLHLPPWMEEIMNKRNLQYRLEDLGEDGHRYIITRKECFEP